MTECVPGDLLSDSQAQSFGLDVVTHNGAQPERLFAPLFPRPQAICGKHPNRWIPVWCLLTEVAAGRLPERLKVTSAFTEA